MTIFAPADPERVCPFGQRDLVVKPDKPCSPCFMYPWQTPYPQMRCTPPFCIEEVTVEQVMEKVPHGGRSGSLSRRERVRVRGFSMTEASVNTDPPHPDPLPQGEGEMRHLSSRKQLLTAIKFTLCIATVIFVAIALSRNLRGFDWRNFHPNLACAILAAISIVGVTLTQIAAYRLLLAAYGPKLTWPQAATLSWVPGLTKYIPGKVVAIGSTVYLLRRYSISAAVAVMSVALMGDAVAVLTGLIAGADADHARSASLSTSWSNLVCSARSNRADLFISADVYQARQCRPAKAQAI